MILFVDYVVGKILCKNVLEKKFEKEGLIPFFVAAQIFCDCWVPSVWLFVRYL